MLSVGSLFGGIGGIDLGLERAGMRVVWQSEVDPYACGVLRRHWPHVPNLGDVRRIVRPPAVDVLAGGFPCQDISAAGKGAGIGGERSGLWFEMLRIIGECRPRWVVAENVAALRTRGADVVLDGLERAGYACWPLVVGAVHAGAPHRRLRVWIVARADTDGIGRRGVGSAGGDRPEPGRGGAHVADADSERQQGERRGGLLDGERPAFGNDADRRGRSVPDAERERLERIEQTRAEARATDGSGDGCGSGWWSVEPDVGRVAHGIPRRVDRLRCLGNAVVPQVVEAIGRAIVRVEAHRQEAKP